MKFKIGFGERMEHKDAVPTCGQDCHTIVPRKSVVQVYFPERKMQLAYYNDMFDLHRGDLVYVDGKLEGKQGRVIDVNYNFKIKLSEYKRVIAVADTEVHGEFRMAGSHFVTFDPVTLPAQKAITWFKPPVDEEDFVSGTDDTKFCLDDLSGMKVSPVIADRGHEYYIENKVRYLCLNGSRGYAIVEGNETYEVEFEYHNGEISGLTCSCFCSYNCKHDVAVMLQLRETLEMIKKHYADEYERADYFAAVNKATFFDFVINGKEKGSFLI